MKCGGGGKLIAGLINERVNEWVVELIGGGALTVAAFVAADEEVLRAERGAGAHAARLVPPRHRR